MHSEGLRLFPRMTKAARRRLIVFAIERTIKGVFGAACTIFTLLAAMMLMDFIFRLAGVAG